MVTPLSYALAANLRPFSKIRVLFAPKALRFAADPTVLLAPTLLAVTKFDWFALILANASSVEVTPCFKISSTFTTVIGEALCAATPLIEEPVTATFTTFAGLSSLLVCSVVFFFHRGLDPFLL
ncbi:Uncharacterised protein [Acinetobacter baumannii]|nr:Uncharacterised protein [Acinetobacter baumannii]